MKKFFQFLFQVKQYKGLVILHFVCYILTAIFTVASIPAIIPLFEMLFRNGEVKENPPATLQSLSDYFQYGKYQFTEWLNQHDKIDSVFIICIVIASIFFFKNLFKYLAVYFITPVRANLIRNTRHRLFSKMMDLPLSFFSEEKKGDLIARMTSDVSELEFTLINSMESLVKDPLIILGSLIFMLYTSIELTFFVLILLLITAFIIGGISRTLRKKSVNAQREFGELIALLEESLGGLRVIKVFGSESYVKSRFSNILNRYKNELVAINRRRELASPLSEFLGILIVCILLWYGAKQVFFNQLDASTFLAFLYAFFNVIDPSKSLSAAYFNIYKGMAALERIDHIIDIPIELKDQPGAEELKEFKHEIRFENVSFGYPNQSELVLNNINLTIRKGETVAIVGSSGSGKSTLVDLIARFHDLIYGTIYIDGHNLKNIKIQNVRELMGMVTQEPILFNDSIRRNIEFSNHEFPEDELMNVLSLSYSNDFVLQDGRNLESNIGDRGSKLSGGQRQRLTIARALLRNPQILILDEATSALDSASETIIQAAMENILKNRTAIVIAHRLSTIKKADQIIVLKEGRIVEQGRHEDLIRMNGEYCNFVELQSLT
ncbi:MAG: ABC transporter ATP-binding protein [Saprospiraceae bacterium]|nr:ABC transporter ATP-binding protein [Saprospiraceae bacterium]